MSKIISFGCGPKNSVTKQPVKIVKTLQERDNIPCKLRTEGLIVIVTENNYEEYQLRPTSENPICSNNAWVILDSNPGGLDVDKSYRADKRILYLGGQSPNVYENYFNLKDALVAGNNIFTSLNGVPDGGPLDIFSRGYIGVGFDIFKDFTGDTDYRPEHPAHDSLVGYGRAIGTNIKDGTNLTMMGTTVFHRNDRPLMDNVHAFGKGVTNGLSFPEVPRRTNATSNNWSFSNMVTDVNVFGAEMWCGDIHSSTIVGSNVRMYSYIFASVVLGNHNMNLNNFYYPGETGLVDYLDHDIIIGNGIFKDPKKYPATHNLLIGSQDSFGSGGAPNLNYNPLIEGNFKGKWLKVNGKFSNNDERSLYTPDASYHQSEYLTRPLSLVSIPAGASGKVTFDSTTGILTFTNAPAGRYVLAENIPSGSYFYTALNSNMSRTYNMRILSYSYNNALLGWPYADLHVYSDGTYPTNEFAIELTDITSGTIQCALKYVDSSNLIKSIDKVYDKDKNLVLETKTSTLANSTVLVGSEVAKKYFTGTNNAIFGNFNLSVASRLNSSSIVGTNNAKLLEAADKILVLGNNNLNKLTIGNKIFSIGVNNFPNATSLQWSYTFGDANFSNFIGGPTEDTTYNSNLIGIGSSVAFDLISGQNAILMGRNTGYGATTINNSIAIVPKNGADNTFGTSTPDNAIVISGNSTTGFGSNTTTIGNAATVATYLYGDLYKTKSINFTLKTSITASENMLVPATDGASLLWYNNSKVSMKLIGETTSQTTVLNEKLALHRAKLKSYTKAERNALATVETGEMIWQTDAGNSGLRVFNGTNWLAIPTTID